MNLPNPLSHLRDLRWRLRQWPPRLRLLARWCLTLILGGTGTAFIGQILTPAKNIVALPLAGQLLSAAGWTVFACALFSAYGLWRGHRQRHLKAAEVSRTYDVRWSAFYPAQAMQALLSALLMVFLENAGLLGASSTAGRDSVLTLTIFFVGGNLVSEGVRMLKLLLRDLTPPRAKTAKTRRTLTLGLPGTRLFPG